MKKRMFLIILAVISVLAISGIAGLEYYVAQPEFCGSCHTIMKKPYESWAKSGHKDVNCVDCHFAPGKEGFLTARFKDAEHFLANLFTTAEANDGRKLLKAGDLGCTTSQCHSSEASLYVKVNRAENVPFNHKPHGDRIIEGKILNCGTCHSGVESDKNYTVSQETCYLCNGLNHVLEVYF